MPVQKAKSALAAKLGGRLAKAHEASKDKEVKYSEFGDLPEGIDGGIAQLVDCKFDTYKKDNDPNKGQYFFYAAGVVKSPTEHNGIRIEGLRTSITEPMCDTPSRSRKTVEEHLDWVYNELKKLGVDTSSIDYHDLEQVAAALKEAKPHFRFRTWKGQKQATGKYANQEPRVQHSWNGVIHNYESNGDYSHVVDNSDDNPEGALDNKDATKPTDDDVPDLTAMAKLADSGDQEAGSKLENLALEAGIEKSEIDDATSWAVVVKAIEKSKAAAGDEGSSEDVPWEPAKEEVYKYAPAGASVDKKGKKKLTECEVLSVDKGKKTVVLKNLDNPKVQYKSVPWSDLETA